MARFAVAVVAGVIGYYVGGPQVGFQAFSLVPSVGRPIAPTTAELVAVHEQAKA
jgi:hypothetical protein